MKSENFEAIFEGKKMLLPKPTDLSYYNWEVRANFKSNCDQKGFSKQSRLFFRVRPSLRCSHRPNR